MAVVLLYHNKTPKKMTFLNEENHAQVTQIANIVKQDVAISSAARALSDLLHVAPVNFEEYGKEFGLTKDLLAEIAALKKKIEQVRYNRF